MTDLAVRRAGPKDATLLAELHRIALEEFGNRSAKEPDAVARIEPGIVRWFEEGWLSWIALSDDQPVGHVYLYLVTMSRPLYAPHPPWGYAARLYVRPEHRSKGVDAAVVAAMLAHCRDEDVTRLIVWPDEHGSDVWRQAGFQAPSELLEVVFGN